MHDQIPHPFRWVRGFVTLIHCLVHRNKFFHVQDETALFQNVTIDSRMSPLMFLFGKLIFDISILLMIPLPFAKFCKVDERI
jgi:hypothetical protein